MIEFLAGKIHELTPDHIVMQCGDVAYYVHISLMTFDEIKAKKTERVYTHLQVKEDAHTLYGFASLEERRIFRHLISVSGIGTNTARLILSSMKSNEVLDAVASEDEKSFLRIKGIGARTAKRIILDLKGKMGVSTGTTKFSAGTGQSDIRSEALSALLSLGFGRAQIIKAIDQIVKSDSEINSTEGLIRKALQSFSS